MKTNFIVLLFLMLTNIINSQSNLQFSVFFNKTEYLEGEPVELGLGIENQSDKEIDLALLDGFYLEMEDDKGNKLNSITSHGGFIAWGKRSLKPGEELYRVVVLNTVYGIRYRGFNVSAFYNIGNYTVKISYYFKQEVIFKKQLKFKVNEPFGNEHNAYNLFKNAIEEKTRETETYINILEGIINKYPNSVYVPLVLVHLEAVYGGRLNLPEKAEELKRMLIENYTFSGQSYYFLGSYLERNVIQINRNSYLTNLKAKSTGSIMEKYIESLIKKY